MCGFTLFYNFKELENKSALNRLHSIIYNRGPDKKNSLILNNDLFMLFQRLSIKDLSDKATQPLVSKSGKLTILFNGEIYNTKYLLKKFNLNSQITTNCDTEVLLETIDSFGLDSLNEIEGMFSFILFNNENNTITLVNDRFGEKPLYYFFDQNRLLASSDIKSFYSIKKKINQSSIANFLEKNCISYPSTIWENIFRIEPSEIITFKINFQKKICKKIENYKYYQIQQSPNVICKDEEDIIVDRLDNLLSEKIENYLDTDVKCGTFLSGGIDSTLITAIANKIKPGISSYNIGFQDNKISETPHAIKIAEYLNLDFKYKILSIDDLNNEFENIFEAYGEPFSDSSQLATMLLAKFASKDAKVVLTGDGGDELFGGYNRYEFILNYWKLINKLPLSIRKIIKFTFLHYPNLIQSLNTIINLFTNKYKEIPFFESKLNNLFMSLDSKSPIEFSNKLSSHFIPEFKYMLKDVYLSKKEPMDSSQLLKSLQDHDINNYLPNDLLVKVDRATMFYGLEARSPFVNHKIYEFSNTVPDYLKVNKKGSKLILKKLLSRYLPEYLFDRPKQGFLVPLFKIAHLNIDELNFLLDKNSALLNKIFNMQVIQKVVKDFKDGKSNSPYLIWDIIIFVKWLNHQESFDI